jgi:hypothetical protein
MAAFLDLCRFNPTAGGTADWTYSSPVTGYQSPTAAGAVNGRLYKYRAESADLNQWEVGEGTYSSGAGTFVRSTVLFNSSGNTSKINFSAAPQVAIVAIKSDLLSIEEDNSFAPTQQTQARKNLYAAPSDALLANGLQVNGAMELSQEKGSTLGNLGSGNVWYAADQFFVTTVGTQVVGAQNVADGPAGLSRSIKITVGTANASLGSSDTTHIRTRIEGYRSARLGFGAAGAQSLTIGFWVKANRTGTYTGAVRNGAADRSYPFAYSISASNTWEFKTVTLAGDTSGTWLITNGVGLDMIWQMAAGSSLLGAAGAWTSTFYGGATGQINGVAATSDTFQLTGVVILPGAELLLPTRSALILRSFDQELELCKRYWQKSYDYATAVGTATNNSMCYWQSAATTGPRVERVPLDPEMRSTPTVTLYDNAGASGMVYKGVAGIAGSTFFISAKGFSGGTTNTTAVTELAFHFTADARL